MRMRLRTGVVVAVLVAGAAVWWASRGGRALSPDALREYEGVYEWEPGACVYVQIWNELTGRDQLVAIDDSGEVRALFPRGRDRFFAGPGAALASSVESRIRFVRAATGVVASLRWEREGAPPRSARRIGVERSEDVSFTNREIRLAGRLIAPEGRQRFPAAVLVHGSGPQSRDSVLPLARFLVRRGMAVLAYDKRGVGGSTGDWTAASYPDLASDAIAAVEYLRTRRDVDPEGIGLLGWSQAGWIMPIAALLDPGLAFLISVSGAGVSPAETALDHARHEMLATGVPPPLVEQITGLMALQYEYGRSGEGWEAYAAARSALASRMPGSPPESFPASPDHPHWEIVRRLYLHDPVPVLRQVRVPTLALFGERDNNILPGKNRAAWHAALEAAGNPDFTLVILPRANHAMLESAPGTNADMAALQRFVPEYFTSVHDWLSARVRGVDPR